MEASPDPTLEEIAQRSAEIREAWTDTQRLSRAVGPVAGWLPPLWPNVEDDADERGWN